MANHEDDGFEVYYNPETDTYTDADGQPVEVEEVSESTRRFRFGRNSDPEGDEERQRKQELRDRERALRDAGNAKRRKYIMWAMIGVAVISLMGTYQSCGAVSESDVSTIVDERLEAQGSDFPTGQAVMWAGQVVTSWANWDAQSEKARQTLIAPFLSQGMDAQAGWDGKGKQTVLNVMVNPEPQVLNANRAIVNASYLIQDGTWRCLALKMFSTKPKSFSSTAMYAFTLSGNPTPIACNPTTGSRALPKEGTRTDQDAASELQQKFFPGFFAAWASSDQDTLGQFLDDGVSTVGLSGAFRSDPKPVIDAVTVPIQEEKADKVGSATTAAATVTWRTADGDASVTATYNVPMARRGGQWFVAGEPAPSAQDPDVNGRSASNSGAKAQGGKDGDPNNPNNGSSVYPTPSQATPAPSSEYAPGDINDDSGDSSAPAAP